MPKTKLFPLLPVLVLALLYAAGASAQTTEAVKIVFEKDAARTDIVTGQQLPDYTSAQPGSFQFFMERIDKPEDFVRYFHDGRQTVNIDRLVSMEKFKQSHAQWRLKYRTGRNPSPQYIPRVYSFAVSFVPLDPATGQPKDRVHVMLNEFALIDWGPGK